MSKRVSCIIKRNLDSFIVMRKLTVVETQDQFYILFECDSTIFKRITYVKKLCKNCLNQTSLVSHGRRYVERLW